MSAFISKLSSCVIHQTGFVEIPGGLEISKFPVFDQDNNLIARLGHGLASAWADSNGWRLPSVAEYDSLHKVALFISPYTLPTSDMLKAAGISANDVKSIDKFRNNNMRSKEWCEKHDKEVFTRLAAANWTDQPVSNAGKHWVQGGVIYGWWKKDGTKIQNPSTAHRSDTGFTDYATNFHVVRKCANPSPSLPPKRTQLGDKGEAVKAWQNYLVLNGFNPGTPDGIHGKKTEEASLAWEKSK